MTKEEKGKIIDELAGKISNHQHFYITDASGLTVAQINAFRRLCFKAGVEYRVYKNSLIQKALEKQTNKYDELFGSLKGFSGVLFSKEIGNLPAKVLQEYQAKVTGKPAFKAASIDFSFYIGEEHLSALSKLKSKKELLGDIIGLLQSPTQNVLSALLSGKNKLAGIVKTLEDRKS